MAVSFFSLQIKGYSAQMHLNSSPTHSNLFFANSLTKRITCPTKQVRHQPSQRYHAFCSLKVSVPTTPPNSQPPSRLLIPSDSTKTISLFPIQKSVVAAAAVTLPFLLKPQDAFAAGGEFGILEGRSLALVHPIVMGGLFVYTLYAGYLGWQWRRVRTLQDEINELKKQDKAPVAVTVPEGAAPAPPSPAQLQIQRLTESIGGGVNTYLRTGKLFSRPHLYAAAAITVLSAAAAALVPPMQKGNETARNLHIALNVLNVLLFIWQIPTGLDIVLKVFEFTKWP
ncbi:hypothetical protein QVD17_03869 [Tagetes erecta]|uniref:Uncharacterized protein n=1 Tax=Tagetes erecta TaxID=13708 RepID=A0AAD8LF69_TARER|nr:hypothetical protein QVD17_03869 [Tagetes erecta]